VPDVIKLLEQDHREVEELFAKVEATSGAARQQVVTKIASALTLHTEVEERFVYPAMRDAGIGDLVSEAEQEHAKVKELVAQLEAMDATTDDVEPLLAELKADVEHHVQVEETEAFPDFRDSVDQSELQTLAIQVREAQEQARA
jgi:iron-sulfur cluster repair protein YtfE (RIC family)